MITQNEWTEDEHGQLNVFVSRSSIPGAMLTSLPPSSAHAPMCRREHVAALMCASAAASELIECSPRQCYAQLMKHKSMLRG